LSFDVVLAFLESLHDVCVDNWSVGEGAMGRAFAICHGGLPGSHVVLCTWDAEHAIEIWGWQFAAGAEFEFENLLYVVLLVAPVPTKEVKWE